MILLKLIVISTVCLYVNAIAAKKFESKVSKTSYFGKLNQELELQKPSVSFPEAEITWNLDNNSNKVNKIYGANKLERPNDYTCLPDASSCLNLKINSLKTENLGQYLRKTESVDGKTSTSTEYFVFAYGSPIGVSCVADDESETCAYDPKTQTLTVKENAQVSLSCATNLYKASEITTPIEIEHRFRENGTCVDVGDSIVNSVLTDTQLRLAEECRRKFKRTDTVYTCVLKTIESNQTEKVLERLDIKLNIKYPPTRNETQFESSKKVINVAQAHHKELTCPFDGNPIAYVWRPANVKDGKPLSVNRTFIIPVNFTKGLHEIECQAYIPGDLKSYTEAVKFGVNITAEAQHVLHKYRNYFIAAGIVGGAILLGIIGAIIVVVSKKLKGRNSGGGRGKRNAPSAPAPAHERQPLK